MITGKITLSVLSGTFLAFPVLSIADAADAAMDGIVVFSRKRREKILDIPASVTVLSSSMIEEGRLSPAR